MKRIILALVLLVAVTGSVPVKAQSKEVPDSEITAQLKINQYKQLKRLVYLEAAHNALKSDLESLTAQSSATAASVQETLERLAQSERAINATLETFAQKFDDQNKTIADVQEVLDSKMNQMLTYIGVGIAAALVLMIVVARSTASSAVKKHEANWNAFQEHLLKSK